MPDHPQGLGRAGWVGQLRSPPRGQGCDLLPRAVTLPRPVTSCPAGGAVTGMGTRIPVGDELQWVAG